MLLWKELQFNLHIVLYYSGRELRHVLTLCCEHIKSEMFRIVMGRAPRCWNRNAASHRHTVGLLLMLFWVHIWVSHILWEALSHFPAVLRYALRTHISSGICNIRLRSFLSDWTAGEGVRLVFLAGIFQVNKILKITWLWHFATEWHRVYNLGYSCMLKVEQPSVFTQVSRF